ncbi:EF1B factor, partial [Polyodon spathula]|nr:EF1B factor [Polyodon spathula]
MGQNDIMSTAEDMTDQVFACCCDCREEKNRTDGYPGPPCSHLRATASEDNAALGSLQASPQVPGQTTRVCELFHALCWYNHVKSSQEKASLPGVKKPLGRFGPTVVADCTAESKDDADDDIDLFGSDDRVAQYEAKKSKKTVFIAKSCILLDMKRWDNETDMGSSKLVPVGYGIKKLQVLCVVEDYKGRVDLLEELITA